MEVTVPKKALLTLRAVAPERDFVEVQVSTADGSDTKLVTLELRSTEEMPLEVLALLQREGQKLATVEGKTFADMTAKEAAAIDRALNVCLQAIIVDGVPEYIVKQLTTAAKATIVDAFNVASLGQPPTTEAMKETVAKLSKTRTGAQ
jgi:hypothetical protein